MKNLKYIKLIKELKDETYQSAIDKLDSNVSDIQKEKEKLNNQKNALIRQMRKLDKEKVGLSHRSNKISNWLQHIDRNPFKEKYKLSLVAIQGIIDAGFDYDDSEYHILAVDEIDNETYEDAWNLDYEIDLTVELISGNIQSSIKIGKISKMFNPNKTDDIYEDDYYWEEFWDKIEDIINGSGIEPLLYNVVEDLRKTHDDFYETQEDEEILIDGFTTAQRNRHIGIINNLQKAKLLIKKIKKEIFDVIVMIDNEEIDPDIG